MDTELINQIVESLETWKDSNKVGEEVRAMEETIKQHSLDDIDPVMDVLLQLIESNPNDYDLGREIRRIYIPLKIIVNDKGSPEGNNAA